MIKGPTRSGKGTIARINTALLGGYQSVATPTLVSLQTTFGLEPLIGKTLGVISDARLSGRTDQAVIIERLLSLSGEDGVEAARKFKKAWTGRMPIRFTLLTNELPRLSDSSSALARRFIILVLVKSFYGREDQTLTTRLLTLKPNRLALRGRVLLLSESDGLLDRSRSRCGAGTSAGFDAFMDMPRRARAIVRLPRGRLRGHFRASSAAATGSGKATGWSDENDGTRFKLVRI
jgi:hypothetical protein